MKELVSVRTGNWIDRTSGLSEKSQKYNFSLIVSPALLNSVGVGDDYSQLLKLSPPPGLPWTAVALCDYSLCRFGPFLWSGHAQNYSIHKDIRMSLGLVILFGTQTVLFWLNAAA